MRLNILGPLELSGAGGAGIPVSGRKRRSLLATLAVCANHAVPVSRLTAELWGDTPPANAANALQAHVTRVRKAVEVASGEADRIVTSPPGYALVLHHNETDADEFRSALAGARALPPAAAIPALRAALGVWRGGALEGCLSGDICFAEATALEESRLAAMEALYDACLLTGRHAEVTGELARACAAYPLRERFYDQWMDALCRSGRHSEALAVYERAARELRAELGLEPGPELRARAGTALRRAG